MTNCFLHHRRYWIIILAICLMTGGTNWAAAQDGHVQIQCEPGVQVFLDGTFKGTTNSDLGGLILQNVSTGSHTIKLVKSGYAPKEGKAKVEPGKVLSHKFTISKETEVHLMVNFIEGTIQDSYQEQMKKMKNPSHGDTCAFDLGDGVKLEMVYIQGGTFQMGSPSSESGRSDNEGPVHAVELDGFWMGKFEVTQEQYQSIMGSNPSHFKDSKNPVEKVSWKDAKSFCDKLSQKTGQTFRLPTEAEWEYACRAGSSTAYCFGDSESQLGDYAWYNSNSGRKTHPVGGKRPNTWGLYDMHGNVWEWCGDWPGNYSSGLKKNPTGPATGSRRVLRGGSWGNNPGGCRSAYRNGGTPGFAFNLLGFRAAASPSR